MPFLKFFYMQTNFRSKRNELAKNTVETASITLSRLEKIYDNNSNYSTFRLEFDMKKGVCPTATVNATPLLGIWLKLKL